MLKRVAHRVSATPQPALMVSEHLTQDDVAQCIRVCRAWSRYFEPILWRDFCLDISVGEFSREDTPTLPMKAALIRNLSYLRTIKCHYANVTLLQLLSDASNSSTPCPNLRRLEFQCIDYKHHKLSLEYMTTLLDRNRRLTHLCIPFEFIGFSPQPSIILAAVSKQENLQRLTVHAIDEWKDSEILISLLQACLPLPNLTELFLDVEWKWSIYFYDEDAPRLETILKEASVARFSHSPDAIKIKSLRLPINRSGSQTLYRYFFSSPICWTWSLVKYRGWPRTQTLKRSNKSFE
ncbi:hypothetical protein BGZ68_003345, partial [Mortierella alpina]